MTVEEKLGWLDGTFHPSAAYWMVRGKESGEKAMVMQVEHERNIEDLGKHTAESIGRLRQLLAGGAQVYPDPKRPDFYEVESGSDVYYIHISPVTGKIFLLATWKTDLAAESAEVHQAA